MTRPTDHPTIRPATPSRPAPAATPPPAPTTPTTDRPTSRPRDDQPTGRSADHDQPRWLTVALPVAIWGLTAVVTFLALSGQVEFAEWAGITDHRKYLVPVGLELTAVGFLLVGYQRARRGYSPASMWLLGGAVGGFAVWTNVVHAGHRAGPLFGAFTAIALALWFIKLRDDYGEHRRRTGQGTQPLPKFGARLWLTSMRQTFRAAIIATQLQICDVNLSTRYAQIWRWVHDDAKTAGVPRKLRRRTAWLEVMRQAGHPVADLPTTAEVATVAVVDRPTPPLPDREPTVVVDRTEPEPTGQARTGNRPADRRKATKRPTGRPVGRPLHMVWSPTVVANAAAIRDRYGDTLPEGMTDRQVRDQMGWSHDRAKSALSAYRAGADREKPTGPTDRAAADDDKEDAAA